MKSAKQRTSQEYQKFFSLMQIGDFSFFLAEVGFFSYTGVVSKVTLPRNFGL